MKNLFLVLFILLSLNSFGQEWQAVASLPDNFNTHHSFAFSINDVGYMVAGDTPNGSSSSFYSYDHVADEWTKKDDFPGQSRGFAIGDVMDGKAYFGFGSGSNGVLDDLWEFDPITDEWKQLATCDCDARTHPAMVGLNGKIYMGLGASTQGNTNDWWVYDVENDAWEEKTRFPGDPRHHPFQFTDGEYVYVGFGHGNGFISNQWYRYNALDDTWMEVGQLPAEGRVAGTQMSYEGLGLVLSGDGDNHAQMPTGEFWVYDPSLDTWSSLPPHPGLSRWAPSSFIVNDEAYILNGERSGNFLTENFKFDISGLKDPLLNIISSEEEIDYQFSAESCDAQDIVAIEVMTRIAFSEDVIVSLELDPQSTAIEGEDFILQESSKTLEAGANSLEFELIIFDDAILNENRLVKFNLVSDAEIGAGSYELELIDNDIEFGTESLSRSLKVGKEKNEAIAPFSRFYTNARSQMLYRSDLIKNAGIVAGPIERIAFDILSAAGQSYIDFTVSIAHTSLNQLSGTFSSNSAFVEVFKGSYGSVNGINDIQFDTPFEYDGESNLIIQICFDNNEFTSDDLAAATDVGYNSTVTVQADFVFGCPSQGFFTSTNILPNLIVYQDGFYPLFNKVNQRFQSGINENESIYFTKNDSILAIVENVSSVDPSCFSSELISNSNTIMTTGDIEWIDRIYWISNEDTDPNNYEVTLLMPNMEEYDFESEELIGLYTSNEIVAGSEIEWNEVEINSVVINEEYVSIKLAMQGSGYYTIGGEGLVITSTEEEDFEFTYDQVTITDAMGKVISRNRQDVNLQNLSTGIYFKTYSKDGVILKTIKMLK